MIPTGITCWLQFPAELPYTECAEYEASHGGNLCPGVPVDRYDPELDQFHESCSQCGATPPESGE